MTFKELMSKVEELSKFEKVETDVIGCSVCGRPIYAFHVGSRCGNQIIITGAIHAREWITALLVVELVKIHADSGLLRRTAPRNDGAGGIWFVPLCNPDGVEIALDGECEGDPLWKANARGVDLNVNFDADWGCGAQNLRVAGPENYIGSYPNSEPETLALIDFTCKIQPRATVAYHSKGELVYYAAAHSEPLAHKIAEITGYIPEKTHNSAGGYSDWVSMHLRVPALTIEVGNDDYCHPLGVDKLPEILAQNIDVPRALLDHS